MIDEKDPHGPSDAMGGDAMGSNGEPDNQRISGDFAMALGTEMCGRLIFASGAADVRLNANPTTSELYSAHFEEHIPSVRVHDGVVTIHYRRYLLCDWLAYRRQPLAKVALNATIPWEIEFRDGVSRLTADLHQLQVCALDMGSVHMARLTLPIPIEVANIYLSGSASDLALQRPADVALRLQIAGAANDLMLDDQRFGVIGSGMHWQSHDYNDNAHRYEIGIAGSVSNLRIDTFDIDAFDTYSR